jgi:hypothetical protein
MNTLNSFTQKQKTGSVKLEPRFHSAISAGLRGVSPKRIRVLRASLAAAAAAAVAAVAGGGTAEKSARLRRTEKGSICALRTPSEPKKLTCDLLGPAHLKFESAFVSVPVS